MNIRKIIKEEIQRLSEEPGRFKPLPEPKRHAMSVKTIDTRKVPIYRQPSPTGRPDRSRSSVSQPTQRANVMSQDKFDKLVKNIAMMSDDTELTYSVAADLAMNLYHETGVKEYLRAQGITNTDDALEYLTNEISNYA